MAENDVIDEVDKTEEEEEDIITCPVCGEDIEPGTDNCPLCGAPVSALENNDISGTSIDNSAAIDAMLQSAAMLVEESSSLGVALDEDEDDDTDEEGLTRVADYDEDPDTVQPERTAPPPAAPAPPPPPVPAPVPPPDDIQRNQTVAVPPSAPPAAKKGRASGKKSKQKKGAPTLYAVDEKGEPIPGEDEEIAGSASKKPAKPKKTKNKTKSKVKNKGKNKNNDVSRNREKSDSKGGSPVLVIVTAFVALALGCAVGFFGKTMFFPDVVVPQCQEFAERAVLGVNSVVDGNIYVSEAYVRESGDSTQCVFRAVTYGAEDTAQVRWFRVKVFNDAPDTVRIYFQLDMDRYNAMMNSGDDEQRIQASLLMSNQQEMERCISEIQNGASGWDAAIVSMLNDSLHPIPEQGASAYNAGQ